MAKKKTPKIDPGYLNQQRESLLRNHRQVIYLNSQEMDAINAYCRKFKVKSKASLLREAIMEKIISELEENHPTLF